MGTVLSKAQVAIQALSAFRKTYGILNERINASPGLPIPNPTLSFWTVPAAPIFAEPEVLPEYADIVIIGSGITGASVAYNILSRETRLKIVILEAREVCSGATGRNGGHINAPLYHDYDELEDAHGVDIAKRIIAFRRAHLTELQRIVAQEDILKQSQCRETEHVDVFTCPKAFAEAKEKLAKWRAAMPVESSSFVCYEREEAIEKFHLSDAVLGCIANAGGAVHPYRFVTSLLSILLSRHSGSFDILTNTPCTAISGGGSDLYTLATPRGTLRARHVVHATNGWCSHLLPALRTKIMPARGAMSAQRPGRALSASTQDGARSFVFYRGTVGIDYLTQLPTGEHELMFGGGWSQSCDDGLPELGIADDGSVNHASQSYLAGALPQYFGPKNWGEEAQPAAGVDGGDVQWGRGRTKAQWSGILGISADEMPWVGRVPKKLTGRSEPKPQQSKETAGADKAHLALPGEWIAAGYTGEGMVHAWMSGKALAHMLLDREDEIQGWFPEVMRMTEKRWKEADVNNLFKRFM
ncbi:FAD dependent oxidoreductase [Lenzites betulinus]|nr:FAD dependent oxidoreductase [Lenzites betulinus]